MCILSIYILAQKETYTSLKSKYIHVCNYVMNVRASVRVFTISITKRLGNLKKPKKKKTKNIKTKYTRYTVQNNICICIYVYK